MVEWLAGNRIRGTSTERTSTTGIGNEVGGWKELGRTTLGSSNANINISNIPDKRYYMLLSDIDLGGASTGGGMRLGSGSADTGANYAFRASGDGGAGTAYTNRVNAHWVGGYGDTPEFYVTYIANKSDKEKLVLSHRLYGATVSGAGVAPKRNEFAGKWTNTSNPLDYINYYQGGSDTYDSGSELVLLGWDPADTHTSNFWEELASVNGDGTSTTLSSGTITAKKYIWTQLYSDATSNAVMRFNSDSGSNYARRGSVDGASDFAVAPTTGSSNLPSSNEAFGNCFIINNASNEKLGISHGIDQGTAGAGTAPTRKEEVFKWANTSDSITNISWTKTGNWSSNTILKVWGHD